MTIRDEDLLARLRALGTMARRADAVRLAGGRVDPVGLLGLPADELTPSARAALAHLIAEVAQLRGELHIARGRLDELERLADEDPLAPVSNRRAFLRHLDRTIAYVRRYRASCSLIYFDVDNLKAINDAHGHAAGDATLLQVARTLSTHTRRSDLVGRLGGDEFGVILTRADGTVAQTRGAELAARLAARPVTWSNGSIRITVSFGAHEIAPDEPAVEALAAADRAMYRHKRTTGGDMSGDDVG